MKKSKPTEKSNDLYKMTLDAINSRRKKQSITHGVSEVKANADSVIDSKDLKRITNERRMRRDEQNRNQRVWANATGMSRQWRRPVTDVFNNGDSMPEVFAVKGRKRR